MHVSLTTVLLTTFNTVNTLAPTQPYDLTPEEIPSVRAKCLSGIFCVRAKYQPNCHVTVICVSQKDEKEIKLKDTSCNTSVAEQISPEKS